MPIALRSNLPVLIAALAGLLLLSLASPAVFAVTSEQADQSEKADDPIVIDNTDPIPAAKPEFRENTPDDDKITLVPARAEVDVVPGRTTLIPAILSNRTGEVITISLRIGDLQASSDPGTFVQLVRDAEFGAGSWVDPQKDRIKLEHGELIEFFLVVRPPVDAPVGSHYAGIEAFVEAEPGTSAAQVALNFSALGQLLLNVPGDEVLDTNIVRVTPSETLFFGGSFIDRFLRETPFVSYDIRVENKGNVTEHVGGKLVVKSMFGNTVRTFKIPERVVLRGSSATIRVVWNNPPRFGRFTAEAQLDTDAGPKERKSDAVTILPPWWWFLVLLVVIGVPMGIRWYNNRDDWREYLDEDYEDDHDWHAPTA